MKKGKFKRFIMLTLAFACLLILILALSGVFQPDRSPVDDRKTENDNNSGDMSIARPSSEGEGWTFTAERAITSDFSAMTFVNPILIYSMASEDDQLGPRIIKAVSEKGSSDGADSPRITLSQNVIIELSRRTIAGDPEESGLLFTDEMTWDRAKLQGYAPRRVKIDYDRGESKFVMTGEEFSIDLATKNMRLEREVKITIAGEMGLLPAEKAAESGEEAQESLTTITCDGPFIGEETTGKAEFKNNIVVTHLDQQLVADELIVWRTPGGEGGMTFGEWRAFGNVRLTAPSTQVRGKEVARSADGTMRLVGNSNSSVKMEGLLIEAPTIIMHLQQGQIIVPSKGRLVMDAQEEGGQPTVAEWQGNMEFDQRSGKAYFTKEVHVTGQDQDVKGNALTLWVDPETNEPLRMLAEGDVLLVMPSGVARGASVMMNMKDQTLELKGEPEARLDMEETRVEGRQINAALEKEEITVSGPGRMAVASGEEGKNTVAASWRGGMKFDRATGKAELQRSVTLITEDSNVNCSELDLWLAEDRSEVDRILARGDVKIKTPEGDGTAQNVVYQMAKRLIQMQGGEEFATFEHAGNIITARNITMDGESGALSSSEPGTLRRNVPAGETAAFQKSEVQWTKKMFFDTEAGKGRFEGDVKLVDAERELFSDVMDMILSEGEDRQLESILAVGGIRLNWDGRRGFGDQFHWIAGDGSGYLNGKPARVAFDQGWFVGDEILFKDNFNEVTVKGSKPVTAGITGN